MKWFKCFCDNHRGRTVNRLLDEIGHSGALIYYFLMELCAEKFEIERGAIASESDCIFTFNRRAIVSVARAKWPTVAHVLAIGAECTVWEWKANGNEIEIKFPMLLNLLDRDTKRPRQKREMNAKKSRLEENRIEENRKDKNINTAAATNLVRENVKTFMTWWNKAAESVDIVKIYESADNVALIARHLAENPDMEFWKKAINAISLDSFYQGDNKRKSRMNIIWFFKSRTIADLLDVHETKKDLFKGVLDDQDN